MYITYQNMHTVYNLWYCVDVLGLFQITLAQSEKLVTNVPNLDDDDPVYNNSGEPQAVKIQDYALCKLTVRYSLR